VKPRLKVVAKSQDNVIAFPQRDFIDDLETLLKRDTIALTPLQLLGVLLKLVLKDGITDEQVDRICTAYYQLIRQYYSE
jgi:hypothetical protein